MKGAVVPEAAVAPHGQVPEQVQVTEPTGLSFVPVGLVHVMVPYAVVGTTSPWVRLPVPTKLKVAKSLGTGSVTIA